MLFSLNRIHTKRKKNGPLALSPMLFMLAMFVLLSFFCGGFSKVPLLIVFITTCIFSLFTLRGIPFEERLNIYSRGAGQDNLMLMIWIFILAGAFAATAKQMGAVDATVNLCLQLLPPSMLLPGLFLASCFISMSIGTSVGTIVALVPIAVGMAGPSGLSEPMMVASCVGGAFFGDNLSFISDTTVVATRSQGVRMSDKFRTNFAVALPAAILTSGLYMYLGWGTTNGITADTVSYWKILPYLSVLITAIMGLNVLIVLSGGILLTGLIGLSMGSYDLAGWFASICDGIGGMSELIIISMMAGGLLAVIRTGGGITWLIHNLTRQVRTVRGAELGIAALVGLTNLCTANNTVAILSVGPLAKAISQRFGVSPQRVASILDTFSCVVQGIIPYGAQLLMAGGLASLAPTAIMPYLFYPYILAIVMIMNIIFRHERSNQTAR